MEQMKDLKSWIKGQEKSLEKDVAYLTEVPSVSVPGPKGAPYGEACREAAARMKKMAEGYGFETEDCEGRCLRVRYGGDGKRVEFWNHLDVVPAGDGWVYPPYGCTRIGDFLIGRGVSDNKGPAVAVLYAMRYLKEKKIRLSYDLRQVCGLAEETGMGDAAWYVGTYGSPELALISDCRFPLCYGEKGRCEMTVRSKEPMENVRELFAGMVNNSVAGEAWMTLESFGGQRLEGKIPGVSVEQEGGRIRIRAQGTAGHAAAPEKCVNPIGILMKAVLESGVFAFSSRETAALRFLELACRDGYGQALGLDREDPVFGNMSFAGTVLRMREGKAKLQIDVRFPPSVRMEEWAAQMKEKAADFGMEVTEISWTKGYLRNLEEPWIKALLEAYREVCGPEKQPYVMGGNTYARFFERGVGFGPGTPKDYRCLGLPAGHGGGHACDEVQSVTSLFTAIEVYVKALIKLNGLLGG